METPKVLEATEAKDESVIAYILARPRLMASMALSATSFYVILSGVFR